MTNPFPTVVVEVQPSDLIVVVVPVKMSDREKKGYLQWFAKAVEGTAIEGRRTILMDGGAHIEVYRGEHLEGQPEQPREAETMT